MELLKKIDMMIGILFTLCYAYQLLYIPVSLFFRERKREAEGTGRNDYAVLIPARNEEKVIGDLIDCLKGQTYPEDKLHVFVMADNCTDSTAAVAAAHGAAVFTRYDRNRVGKGYVLDAMLREIKSVKPDGYDGYFVFDADSILEPDYVEQMDRTFCQGYGIVTSYRNSKNYGDNWISAGYALWFLRESRYLSRPRHLLGGSCAVSGTGFLFSREVEEETGGWPFHLLTEDIEFSVDQITSGRKIGYCGGAVLYDEQPTAFRQSWDQRMRWSRGYLQVFKKYGRKLAEGALKGSFACFDMTIAIMPAFILSAVSVFCNLSLIMAGLITGQPVSEALEAAMALFIHMYGTVFVMGAVTTITEWKRIRTGTFKKLLYMFTLPVFMFTYIPISVVSLFRDTTWKPIEHRVTALQAGLVRRKEAWKN